MGGAWKAFRGRLTHSGRAHDDEHIHIRIIARTTVRVGAEEDDFLRLESSGDLVAIALDLASAYDRLPPALDGRPAQCISPASAVAWEGNPGRIGGWLFFEFFA